jgi:hypothetical protein
MEKTPINRFIDYFSKPLNMEQITYLNQLNEITVDKITLFRDFIISLIYLIDDTYLGDDYIKTINDKKSHFNWCWDKNIENYKKENFEIKKMGEHYFYFFNYVNETYYNNSNKNKLLFNRIIDFWSTLMVTDKLKTKSEYDLFLEICQLLTKYFFN